MILPLCLLASSLATAQPVCAVAKDAAVCRAAPKQTWTQVGAPSLSDPLGRGTWVIDEENDEVALVLPTGTSRRFQVGRWPQQLVATSAGRVFVSCRQDGRVDVIEPDFAQAQVAVGDEPRALALDEVNHRLYVALVTEKAVVALDTRTLRAAARTAVPEVPTSIALTSAGLAVVSERSLAVRFFDLSLTAETRRVDLPRQKAATLAPRLLVPAPTGDGVLLIAERARTGLDQPVSFGGYGGEQTEPMDTLLFSLMNLERGYAPAATLAAFRANEPVAAAFDGQVLYVASRGRGMVLAIGVNPQLGNVSPPIELRPVLAATLNDTLARAPELNRYTNTDGLTIARQLDLTGVAVRGDGRLVATDALGRRVLELEPSRAVTRSLTTRAGLGFSVFGIGGLSTRGGFGRGWGGGSIGSPPFALFASEVPIAPVVVHALAPGRDAELRVGQHLFHAATDFRISSHGVACASCHPDGREDGRVWSLTGTRRQTPMLTHRLQETAPFNWLGTAATLKANLHQTMVERLEGEGLQGREMNALARFISEGLRPVSAPAPKEPELVALGKDLFNDPVVGCSVCHPADFSTTDGERHDVGSLSSAERGEFRQAHPAPVFRVTRMSPIVSRFNPPQPEPTPAQMAMLLDRASRAARIAAIPPPAAPRKFDTPSLRAVALTAPYFHDGAVASLEELIARNNDRMGMTNQLDETQRRALVAYLQTL